MNIHLYIMVFQKQCDHTKMMCQNNSYLAILVDPDVHLHKYEQNYVRAFLHDHFGMK